MSELKGLLCTRSVNALKKAGVETKEELFKMNYWDLVRIRGLGARAIAEIMAVKDGMMEANDEFVQIEQKKLDKMTAEEAVEKDREMWRIIEEHGFTAQCSALRMMGYEEPNLPHNYSFACQYEFDKGGKFVDDQYEYDDACHFCPFKFMNNKRWKKGAPYEDDNVYMAMLKDGSKVLVRLLGTKNGRRNYVEAYGTRGDKRRKLTRTFDEDDIVKHKKPEGKYPCADALTLYTDAITDEQVKQAANIMRMIPAKEKPC